MKAAVVTEMPNAGLGNKLFSWAHGAIFANNHKLPHYYTGLTKLKIGTILRFEKSWRIYTQLFENKLTFKRRLNLSKQKHYVSYQDTVSIFELEPKQYIFNEVPSWKDYFLHIRENRDLVLEQFTSTLSRSINEKWQKKGTIEIGVHIRLGDFRALQTNENFSKVGQTRTPLTYFINLIKQIRNINGKTLSVTIFSDGQKADLQEIFELPNVKMAEEDNDIGQLLHLSKSKLIILSAGSTFGQWAAFLSSAIIINHFQHTHSKIRDEVTNTCFFEGVQNPDETITDANLINQIKCI